MGDVYIGTEATIKVGSTEVMHMSDWTLSIDAPLHSEPCFGDTWTVVAGQGIKSATGSISGLLSDDPGQNLIANASISGTAINNLRLGVDDTYYWTSNTVANAEACVYFSNYNIVFTANGITKISVDYEANGEFYKTS